MVDLSALQLGDLNVLHGLPICYLNLTQTAVTDLRPLIGLPLVVLTIDGCRVSDLSPLRGMKLRELRALNCTELHDLTPLTGMPLEWLQLTAAHRVRDLSPLRSAPLKYLDLGGDPKVEDLSPLTGMPLEYLNISRFPVTDLSPLRGMPLRELNLNLCDGVRDFSPLAGNPTIEKIHLPYEVAEENIAFLHTLPKLQTVEYHEGNDPPVWFSAGDFLAAYDPAVPEIKAARAALAAGGVEDLHDLPIWRISVGRDHLLTLKLKDSSLADLAPLRGLPVKDLWLWGTPVRSLEPLRGMPLVAFYANVLARDVSPLADCPNLEEIGLPHEPLHVERLRALPKVRYISSRWPSSTDRPEQTAEEFWKEYDARHPAGK
jgi:hypothetical protein